MKLSVYNQTASEAGELDLPAELFEKPARHDLLHRVVTAARHNARQPVAHAKDRAARRGGGKKPWRQKGTGRARHGSVRSPIWKGGGVTFGPTNKRDFKKKVSKSEKRQALASALSAKNKDGEVLLLEDLSFEEPSASEARDILDNLAGIDGFDSLEDRRNNAALVVVPEKSENVELSFRNFGNVAVKEAKDINALDLLTYMYTIVVDPEASLDVITTRVNS